jgi:arginine/ornithine transport system permease protein
MHAYYLSILQASLVTIAVSLASLAVAVVFGLLGAAARLSQDRFASAAGTLYATVVRGIPDLVMMLLVFYGGTMGLNHLMEALGRKDSVDINPFVAGVLTLGFIYGAYMTETFRGAILRFRAARPRRHGPLAWAGGRPFCALPRRKWCATPCPASPTTGWC